MKARLIAVTVVCLAVVALVFAQDPPEPTVYSGYPYFRATLIVEEEHEAGVTAKFPEILGALAKKGAAPARSKVSLSDRTRRMPPMTDPKRREAMRDVVHNRMRWSFMSTNKITASEVGVLYVTICNALEGERLAGKIKRIVGVTLNMMPVQP